MDPNNYYLQSSGAAHMPNYQPAGSAAAASVGPGPAEQAFQRHVRGNPQETLATLVRQTGWRPEWIRRLVHLRATEDPQYPRARRHMPFETILEIMQGEFPDMNLGAEALRVRWDNNIRRTMRDGFRVVHQLPAATAAMLAQGSQRAGQPSSVDPQGARPDAFQHPQVPFQDVHALSHGGRRPGPGASYGGSQPGHHQQFEASQPGPSAPVGKSHVGRHGQQHGAPQSGFGDQHQSIPGANQQLPPIASAQLPENQRPQPMGPPYQRSAQNYNNAASDSQAPQFGQATDHDQETYDQRYQFSDEQRAWILDHGMYMGCEEGAEDEFYWAFWDAFGSHRLPSKDRVMGEFNRMRMQR